MNTPTFTPEPPTEPGDYRWRKTDSHRPILVEVVECPETGGLRAYSSEHEGDFVTHPFFGGLWCRLVPAEEVDRLKKILRSLAHADGCWCDASFAMSGTIIGHSEECEAAKRVMEGKA